MACFGAICWLLQEWYTGAGFGAFLLGWPFFVDFGGKTPRGWTWVGLWRFFAFGHFWREKSWSWPKTDLQVGNWPWKSKIDLYVETNVFGGKTSKIDVGVEKLTNRSKTDRQVQNWPSKPEIDRNVKNWPSGQKLTVKTGQNQKLTDMSKLTVKNCQEQKLTDLAKTGRQKLSKPEIDRQFQNWRVNFRIDLHVDFCQNVRFWHCFGRFLQNLRFWPCLGGLFINLPWGWCFGRLWKTFVFDPILGDFGKTLVFDGVLAVFEKPAFLGVFVMIFVKPSILGQFAT